MNLKLYFRLILTIVEQIDSYKNSYFSCPCIYCKDGWYISLQINKGNYCSSENGYRQFGFNIRTVEWGFPSIYESLLSSSEDVGQIDIEDIQTICDLHGGIDWEQTISENNCRDLLGLTN